MLSAPINLAPESSKTLRHWRARLDLSLRESDGRTCFDHCSHEGPLRVQRLFYPEPGGKAHCYLLHPPGGVVLGDELQINVSVRSGEALLTTPAAGRFYTVDDHKEVQRQTVNLKVESGVLEWLPQETILFNGVNAHLDTRIELGASSELAFWDVVVLGRPACGEVFTEGRLKQTLEVHREGHPLLIERLALAAGDRLSQSRMGMQDQSTIGIMVLTGAPGAKIVDQWLASVNSSPNNGQFTVTQRAGLMIARYLGDDAMRCRQGFAQLWCASSEDLRGQAPATPRIWHT
ncbi:urease accessory protein UreD [Congregibacter sp.]|uniref:urease accessory protein UreD n=1 Tax=Congregibacter sp. TaxID=2744308 RepID=UPI003F6D2729